MRMQYGDDCDGNFADKQGVEACGFPIVEIHYMLQVGARQKADGNVKVDSAGQNAIVIIVLLLLFSLPLFVLVSYFVLLVCYSAIRLLSRKYVIKLSVSVRMAELNVD